MKKKRGRRIALWGAYLQVAPLLGLAGTVIGMLNTFRELAASESDGNTVDSIARGIRNALLYVEIGLLIAMIGFVLLAVALFKYGYRARWFYMFLVVYSVILLIGFPTGTLVGIFLLFHLVPRRAEFMVGDRYHEQVAAGTSR